MACAESRRLYSWWWDSHIIPKNSKWLQENLADMDTKVKSMIKLIEEDADSFARRAEMYYKKRPELMKLVEELYRAYRALAERYDYVTGELRHFQKALQAAFPDQEPFTILEDSSSSTDPDAQTSKSFGLELEKLCQEKIALEKKIGKTEEEAKMFSEQAVKAEMEVEKLKTALSELNKEKEALQALYAECLEKSYKLELSLSSAQSDVQCLTTEIVNSTRKFKRVEENCACLESSNQSLKMELSDLATEIMLKDQEISDKHDELKSKEVETFNLKEELTKLNMSYNSLTSQLKLLGLNPETFGSTVKCLQEENLRLKQIFEKNGDHEEKIKTVVQKNTDLESSCDSLHVENSALVLERTALLSQLHTITINMQKVIDQKTVLEHSVSAANTELQNQIEKSKGLEELCELLNNQKSNLLVERSVLASQLESVQKKLQSLENLASQLEIVQKRLQSLENLFLQFEKEKEMGNTQMLELTSSLTVEKQERESCMMICENRLNDLENRIQDLHKERKLKNNELQEELDEAVIAQFENFILHKFIKEVEEENYFLSVENRKHIEASKVADNLISELETEILDQHVQEELLLVEVENLRLGIYQVFLSLQIGSNPAKISTEQIIGNIKELKQCLSKEEDDKHRLMIENTIISTLLQESESQKEALMNKYVTMKDDFFKVNKENLDLIEANTKLGLELTMLDEEIEEREIIQQNLASELQERENEHQLWNVEAAKFIFDVQFSNTRDILFECKVHELAEVCDSLKAETALKDKEIEEMKQKERVREREIKQLKEQLVAYAPVISSLKASISSLEHKVLTVPNLNASEDVEVKAHPNHNKSDTESLEPNGIQDLIEFQTRITALEKVIVETAGRRKRSGMINIKPKLAKPESEESYNSSQDQKRVHRGKRYSSLDSANLMKGKADLSEVRDIPLDLGSSSATWSRRGYSRSDDILIEQSEMEIAQSERQIEDVGVDKLQVLDQESKKEQLLPSDADSLETTVKTVKQQLEEAEESALHLPNTTKWVHLDDGKKNKWWKGVVLRDVILFHGGNGRNNRRRRRLCGCFKQSPSLSPRPQ